MPRYMLQFSYTPEAWAALIKNPVDRREAARAVIEKVGGQLVDFYYAFGEYDGVIIFESPNNVAQASGTLAAIAAGFLKSAKTTVLLTVEEAMEAMQNAGELSIQAPSSTS